MFTRSHLQELKRRYASMYAPLIEEKFEEHCGVCGEQGIEEDEVEESFELQATMALDDAGVKSKWKKGKLYVAKRDIKKAETALAKSFKRMKKGAEPELYYEEVEIDEEIWIVGDTKSGKIAATAKTEKSAKAFVAARGERRRRGKKWLPPQKGLVVKKIKGDWKKDGDKMIGKPFKEEVEIDEAKSKLPPHLAKFFDKDGNLKKDAAARVAKGREKINWIDVTPKGYGPKEEVEATRMPMEAPFVLSDGVTGPTRMQVQKALDKVKGLLRVRINKTEKDFDIRDLKVDAKGTVQSYKEEVEVDESYSQYGTGAVGSRRGTDYHQQSPT